MRFLVRLLINAAALWVALQIVPGIRYDGHWSLLLAVALVFGVLNTVVRPVLTVLALPLLVLTLGLFTFVINALMLMLTGWVSGLLDLGFHVAGFWPAFWGAFVVSLVSVMLSISIRKQERHTVG